MRKRETMIASRGKVSKLPQVVSGLDRLDECGQTGLLVCSPVLMDDPFARYTIQQAGRRCKRSLRILVGRGFTDLANRFLQHGTVRAIA